MNSGSDVYRWSSRDKWLYGLSLVPFLVAFLGAILLLRTYAIWLPTLLIGFYLLTNFFQAGCCVGCPYRGKYCPAIFGIFASNLISEFLYPNRTFDQEFFDWNATAAELSLLATLLFPVYWMIKTAWWLLPIYLLLIAAHLVTFMPTQCEKCSYQETCPGGISWRVCSAWLKR